MTIRDTCDFYHVSLGYMNEFGGNYGVQPKLNELVELEPRSDSFGFRYYRVTDVNTFISPTLVIVEDKLTVDKELQEA
jgi:hypothetical protein